MPPPPRKPALAQSPASGALGRAKAKLADLEAQARELRAKITCMELDRFAREHAAVEGFSANATWEADHDGEHRMMVWASVDFDSAADGADPLLLHAAKEEIEAILAPWGSQLLGQRFESKAAGAAVGAILMGERAYADWMARGQA